jgi:hypothetical protein
MSNILYEKVSTTGPGSGLALREISNLNPSTIIAVPFSYTFNNTPIGSFDTGVQLPSGSIALYTIIESKSNFLIPASTATISAGMALSPGAPIINILIPYTPVATINTGSTSITGIVIPEKNIHISIMIAANSIASGTINGKIFYTPSLALK